MGGLVIAFKNYSVIRGIWASPWVGLDNFRKAFRAPDLLNVLRNTILISTYKLIFGFPAPIILALLLNEIRNSKFKRCIQTILYLPHFISWVVIYGIMLTMLSPSFGIVTGIFSLFGKEAPYLLVSTDHIRGLLVISSIWKEVGWGTIIYLAAFSTVDPCLYESAIIDGANRWKQMIYITLPSISGVVVLLLILRIGNIMDAGFEQVQVFVQNNDYIRPVIDIFDTFVYRRGIQRADYSYSTTVGLFKSVVSLILIASADRIAKLIGEEGLL
ncbi:MAG TPA: sugar ABC transporter permease [Clostridiaceae bacterium]|nr:sugar ABC transporter permease [Clostridiaceae bacterium]